MDEIIFKPAESKFIKVRCQKCKNEQVIFANAATTIKCLVCEEVLAESKGGKAEVKAEIVERYS